MKKIFSLLYVLTITYVHAQCESYGEAQCISDSSCSWVEEQQSMDCGNYDNSQSLCDQYSSYGCSWEFSWGGWQNYGSYCAGGTFEIDSSYCEPIQLLNCTELSQNQCNHPHYGDGCQWVQAELDCDSIAYELACNDYNCQWINDFQWANCSNYNNASDCYAANNIGGDCDWIWNSTLWQDTCSGGSFQIDLSYCSGDSGSCQEIEMLECSSLSTESNCNYLEECEWVENIDIENCYDILDCNPSCTWQDCEAIEGCNWHFGTAYYDPSYCYGEHEADNSYCAEIEYILGDINEDNQINIQDIILTVNMVIESIYQESADMNSDGSINIYDLILMVDIIIR